MQRKMIQILQNCKTLKEFKQTHLQIIIHDLQKDRFLLPKLIDRSSSLQYIDYSIQIFQNAQMPNIYLYNSMIKCFNDHNHPKNAFRSYILMTESLISPNAYTFTFILKSCELSKSNDEGKQVHSQVLKFGFGPNIFVQNTLLNFYSKCGRNIDSARQLFDEIPERDIVSWNTIISAYITHGDVESAMKHFYLMPQSNVVSCNLLLVGLFKAGRVDEAKSVFQSMPLKNAISWNSMISGYVNQGDMVNARSLFEQMPEKNVVSWTTIISGYFGVGDVESARSLFAKAPIKNVVSWNAMIAGYVYNRKFDDALQMFHEMLIAGEFEPNETTLISVISACTHLGSLEHGIWVHSYIKKKNVDLSIALGNALIDMFAKCGDIKEAKRIFRGMKRRCIITWTTMVLGLAVSGECEEALSLFEEICNMEKGQPDDVLFIAALTACTHVGLVEKGKSIFYRMVNEFHITPRIEHYGCMVDLLGRAGRLTEAINFIRKMPIMPNSVIWATLLGSCKIHGNKELVKYVTRKILDLEPENPGYRVLISNSNASNDRWEDVLHTRIAMRENGIEKVPGCSSIQIGNEVHEFLVKDTRHSYRKEIYETLDGLTQLLKIIDWMD